MNQSNRQLQLLKQFIERRPLVPLIVILLLGLLVRMTMLPISGFSLDLSQHYDWGLCANQNGLFGVYICKTLVTHPPISPTLLGVAMWLLRAVGADVSYFEHNGPVITMLKMPNLLFEIGIVCLVYYLAYKKAGVWWAAGVTALINFNLGWIVVTSWWGQNDATYTFFILLTAYSLTQRRSRLAWLFYGLAWLGKFQSIMFLPILVVFTFRRHGFRSLMEGVAIFAAILVAGVLPFYLGSGNLALTPFIGTVSLFPYVTNGAFNTWYLLSGSPSLAIVDKTAFIGSISYFQVGLVMLVIGTALVCLRVWLLPERNDEYLVFVAANLCFVMLPTQVGVRYFYPGLVFLSLAMIRNWKLVAFYVVVSILFTYNMLKIVWLGVGILYYPSKLMIWTPTQSAIVLVILFIGFMVFFFRPMVEKLRSASTSGPDAAHAVSG